MGNDQKQQDKDADLLQMALTLHRSDRSHWDPIFDKARDDLDFLSDDDAAQWPDKEFNDRIKTGRPTLTIDQLTQFVHQVANNIRMNTPSINPIPSGGKATQDSAKIVKGLIRKIEYDSLADEVYDTGATFAVKCSIGFARVDHDYADGEGFDQCLQIKRVINPFSIYMDHKSIESDGRDQNHCTILEKIRVADFMREYPDHEVSSFDNEDEGRVYTEDEEVTVAEFFIKESEEREVTSINKLGNDVKRKSGKVTIHRYKLSGTQVLSRTTFPGEYIPIVPFYGEEAWKDGQRHLLSLIRKSKQAQYMYNLMKSTETEILLKSPIAPVMVPAGAIENYKEDWKNPSKASALRYDQFDKDDRPLNAPSRLQPPMIPAGIVNAERGHTDDIKATMGLYSNNLGQQGQEVSGKAINARKIQGDVATYHFGDNTVRSITQIGRILVSAIPEIYDTDRAIQIIDEEDKPQSVGINGHVINDQKESHNLLDGKYGIRVTTGTSYTTTRQESAEFYQDVVKTQPDLMKVCGDLLFENMDIAGASKMAARMKKLIDPKLTEGEDGGEEPNPQVMALQNQLQQAQQLIQQGVQEIQSLQQQVKDKNAGVEAKRQTEQERNQLKMMEIQMKQQQQKMDTLLNFLQLNIDSEKNAITEQNNAGNLALAANAQHFDQLLQSTQTITDALQPTELPGQGDTAANDGAVNGMGI